MSSLTLLNNRAHEKHHQSFTSRANQGSFSQNSRDIALQPNKQKDISLVGTKHKKFTAISRQMSASSYQLQKFTTNVSSTNNSLNATMFAANKASQYNLKTVNIRLTDKHD